MQLQKAVKQAKKSKILNYCDDPQFVGTPDDFFKIFNYNLTEIQFDNCNLSKIPIELYNCNNLRLLSLQNNRILQIDIGIGKLSDLTVLNLGENKIYSIPEELGNLKKLYVLDLHRNHITSISVELPKNLCSLRILRLDVNDMEFLPVEIGQFQALEVLALKHNKIPNLPEQIWLISSLQELNISHNKLTELPIDSIKSLPRLKVFHFEGNPLSNLKLQEIAVKYTQENIIKFIKSYSSKDSQSASPSSKNVRDSVRTSPDLLKPNIHDSDSVSARTSLDLPKPNLRNSGRNSLDRNISDRNSPDLFKPNVRDSVSGRNSPDQLKVNLRTSGRNSLDRNIPNSTSTDQTRTSTEQGRNSPDITNRKNSGINIISIISLSKNKSSDDLNAAVEEQEDGAVKLFYSVRDEDREKERQELQQLTEFNEKVFGWMLMKKLNVPFNSFQPWFFVLEDGHFMSYYKHKEDKLNHQIPDGVIKLKDLLMVAEDIHGPGYGFIIKLGTPRKVSQIIHFKCDSDKQLMTWMKAIKKASIHDSNLRLTRVFADYEQLLLENELEEQNLTKKEVEPEIEEPQQGRSKSFFGRRDSKNTVKTLK